MSRTVRIVLANGQTVDFLPGEDFALGAFVTNIRSAGYFCSPDVYVPISSIASIFIYDPEVQTGIAEPSARVGTLQ